MLFFSNKINLFNWRLITLQYYSVFCHTLIWISHACTCVCILNPPPTSLPSHPSGSSQWTSPEHPGIDAFELWCWRRHLRVPWTARRSSQFILKEISPEYSLEGLKLKLQSFGHLMQSWLIWKDPDAGKDWRREEKGMTEDEMVGWHQRLNGREFE